MIPQQLRDTPRWVLWQPILKDGKKTKWPYCAHQPSRLAASNNPETWAAYGHARLMASHTGMGLGFVFNGDGLIGIDLDHVVEDGVVSPVAMEILTRLWSYAEVSPSGTGLHIICRGSIPYAGRKVSLGEGAALEVYATGRYLTITGQSFLWLTDEPQDASEGLRWLIDRYASPSASQEVVEASSDDAVADETVLAVARAASNGDNFIALYDLGDLSSFDGDHSRADASLMSRLAFYTGRNQEQMERLFTASALGRREKWLYRADYRRRTLEQACRTTDRVYSGDHSGRNWLEGLS